MNSALAAAGPAGRGGARRLRLCRPCGRRPPDPTGPARPST